LRAACRSWGDVGDFGAGTPFAPFPSSIVEESVMKAIIESAGGVASRVGLGSHERHRVPTEADASA
jgi:hypothetical protein